MQKTAPTHAPQNAMQQSANPVPESAGARAYVTRWQLASEVLEPLRLAQLRSLTERDSAEIFARLLHSSLPQPSRASSGLVEQQQIFAKLRLRQA